MYYIDSFVVTINQATSLVLATEGVKQDVTRRGSTRQQSAGARIQQEPLKHDGEDGRQREIPETGQEWGRAREQGAIGERRNASA